MIYTKKGDGGYTGFCETKKRVSKFSKIIRTLGALDEANSYLGVVSSKKIDVIPIQKNLMLISSIIAGVKETFPKAETVKLEQGIDRLETKLPLLKHLILPRGQIMYARALVRKAEREVAGLKKSTLKYLQLLIYLNRLSDYLFVFARWESHLSKRKEITWKG